MASNYVFGGNDTILISDVLIPFGLASDSAIVCKASGDISDTIVGADGSAGLALTKAGLKYSITIRVLVGTPLMVLLSSLQTRLANDPTSLTNSTFSATKLTNNSGVTYTKFFNLFAPKTLSDFTYSASSAKDELEIEYSCSGVLDLSRSQ